MLLSVAVNCGLVICGVAPKGSSLLGKKLLTCNTHGPCETYLVILLYLFIFSHFLVILGFLRCKRCSIFRDMALCEVCSFKRISVCDVFDNFTSFIVIPISVCRLSEILLLLLKYVLLYFTHAQGYIERSVSITYYTIIFHLDICVHCKYLLMFGEIESEFVHL